MTKQISQDQMNELAIIVKEVYGQDLRELSHEWSCRRVANLVIEGGFENFGAYLRHLSSFSSGLAELISSLSINVTEMFRDPEVFEEISSTLFTEMASHPKIRIWCAGVASGEEVWSMAILLDEAGLLDRTTIYATDFDPVAIERAQTGKFPAERLERYEQNYRKAGGRRALSEYLERYEGGYRITPRLLKSVVFATHNLATDASFNEFHLILCRNVLIYFNSALTDRAIKLFSQSMVSRGHLVLGGSEWMRNHGAAKSFTPINRGLRLYRRLY